MTLYQPIAFAQGEDAQEPLRILHENGHEAAIDYLMQWDMGDRCELRSESGYGTCDSVYTTSTGYILLFNENLGYIGLEKRVEPEQPTS